MGREVPIPSCHLGNKGLNCTSSAPALRTLMWRMDPPKHHTLKASTAGISSQHPLDRAKKQSWFFRTYLFSINLISIFCLKICGWECQGVLSWWRVRLSILAQVLISGSEDWAPRPCTHWVRESAGDPRSRSALPPFTHAQSLNQSILSLKENLWDLYPWG